VLLSGSLSGTVYGVILAKIRRKPLARCSIAFGPFLATGAVIWTLAGNWIWHWYLLIAGK
jgi:prepilin signal peptidase PulO-like enzyme (type II secretory pathway)